VGVMSDLAAVDDYAVTAAVNPSDKPGGMNTCDHYGARQHFGNHITHTHTCINGHIQQTDILSECIFDMSQ